ncbi:MAG: ATP-binding protein, partial [Candidatus Omnitrophota bacterium]
DTGIGISKQDLPHLFEPFHSTKKGGTGLGLAVTYGIIKEHGGEIKVESREGEGTEFVIELPCHGE